MSVPIQEVWIGSLGPFSATPADPVQPLTWPWPQQHPTAPAVPMGVGWVCPRCSSVYGPQVRECRRCNPPVTTGLGAL